MCAQPCACPMPGAALCRWSWALAPRRVAALLRRPLGLLPGPGTGSCCCRSRGAAAFPGGPLGCVPGRAPRRGWSPHLAGSSVPTGCILPEPQAARLRGQMCLCHLWHGSPRPHERAWYLQHGGSRLHPAQRVLEDDAGWGRGTRQLLGPAWLGQFLEGAAGASAVPSQPVRMGCGW